MASSPVRRKLPGIASGVAAFCLGLAAGLLPAPRTDVACWAEAKRYVSADSGSPYPGKWSNGLAPYLVEPMVCLSFGHPSREVTLKKSHQVGGSEVGLNLIGYVIDTAPSPILALLPTLDEGAKYVRVKLQPAIEATPAIRHKVREQRSRSEQGSTTAFKKFAGGFLQVTGANSSAGLQMVSARVLIAEEISEYPSDAGGRGDPLEQAEKRLTAWSKTRKVFYNSTPGTSGACRVSAKFEASDQRRYYLPCPHCGTFQVLTWGRFRWAAETAPGVSAIPGAYFTCAANGCVIEHHHKRPMVAAGVWIPTWAEEDGTRPPEFLAPEALARWRERPAGGRQPGFAIWQAYSPFASWDDMAGDWLEAEGDQAKERVFVQQVRGEAFEEAGDAPDWENLLRRREGWRLQTLPAGGYVITCGADVQNDGIYYEVVAWGPGKESWSIDYGFLQGDTGDTEAACWPGLTEVYQRRYEDGAGRALGIDRLGIDAQYNAQAVKAWVRHHSRAMALRGVDGWAAPPIGTPAAQEIRPSGKKRRTGLRSWPVGTWSLKSELYAMLRKDGPKPGDERFPPGYCHHGKDHDQQYFRQLTAESLAVREKDGKPVQFWKVTGENHLLDCRVYAMAMAELFGCTRWSAERWAALIAERGPAEGLGQVDLVDLAQRLPGAPKRAAATAADDDGAGDAGAAAGSAKGSSATQSGSERRSRASDLAARFAAMNNEGS